MRKILCLASVSVLMAAAGAANAGFITQATFGPTAVTTELNNIGFQAPVCIPTPLTVGIYTFTTSKRRLATRLSSSFSVLKSNHLIGGFNG